MSATRRLIVVLFLLLASSRSMAGPIQGPPAPGADRETGPVPLLALQGHASGIYFVDFSPDGKRLATCGRDGTVRIWDAATGKEVQVIKVHTSSVYSLAFSPDGKKLATACENGLVGLWEIGTGKSLVTCKGHASDVYHVAFSPDGKTLASTGSDHTVRLWDPDTGKERHQLRGHTDRVLGLTFSPDGSRLVTSCGTSNLTSTEGGEIKVWDVGTGQEAVTLADKPRGVLSVAISPDGKRLAGVGLRSTVRVWELATGKEVLKVVVKEVLKKADQTRDVYGVAFSPEGRWLATSTGNWNEDAGGTVILWDLATGQEVAALGGFSAPVWKVAFSPDGKRLAASSGKFRAPGVGEVGVWDVSALPRPVRAAPTARELDALLADLAGNDPVRAYRATWNLSSAPRQALALLDKHVKPPSNTALERIPQLIKDLDDEDFSVREKASAALERLGAVAFPALRKALESPSLEVRRRAEELLDKKIDTPSITPDEVKALRIIEVLQQIGTPEVRPLLERLARGPAASPVTSDAKLALARLKK